MCTEFWINISEWGKPWIMLIYSELPQVKMKLCKQCLYMQSSETVCVHMVVNLGKAYFWKISDLKYQFGLAKLLMAVNTNTFSLPRHKDWDYKNFLNLLNTILTKTLPYIRQAKILSPTLDCFFVSGKQKTDREMSRIFKSCVQA